MHLLMMFNTLEVCQDHINTSGKFSDCHEDAGIQGISLDDPIFPMGSAQHPQSLRVVWGKSSLQIIFNLNPGICLPCPPEWIKIGTVQCSSSNHAGSNNLLYAYGRYLAACMEMAIILTTSWKKFCHKILALTSSDANFPTPPNRVISGAEFAPKHISD